MIPNLLHRKWLEITKHPSIWKTAANLGVPGRNNTHFSGGFNSTKLDFSAFDQHSGWIREVPRSDSWSLFLFFVVVFVGIFGIILPSNWFRKKNTGQSGDMLALEGTVVKHSPVYLRKRNSFFFIFSQKVGDRVEIEFV